MVWRRCHRVLIIILQFKMDTVRSWVDAGEVRRLAEGLMGAPQENAGPQGDALLAEVEDEGLESHESSPMAAPLATVTKALAAARKVADISGMLHKSEVSEPAEVGNGLQMEELDLEKLMQSHKKWAEQYGLSSVVLIGRDAEVVSDSLGNSKLTDMALKMHHSSPVSGSIFVKVGAKTCLQVVELLSNHGLQAIGMIVGSPLTSVQIEQLRTSISKDLD